MGAMKTLHIDIKETTEKIIKELDERFPKTFPGSSASVYKYLFLEGVGAELIRASAKYMPKEE